VRQTLPLGDKGYPTPTTGKIAKTPEVRPNADMPVNRSRG
jgi:hypothetical protein